MLWAEHFRQTAKAAMPQRILVVDNDPLNRQIIVRFLREANYEVYEADDGDSAIEMLHKDSFELMICDVLMPHLNGFDVIDHMKSRSLPTRVILITGHPDLLAKNGRGHLPSFTKPFNMYDLLRKVREVLSG
jgi:DNA-binding NtrC family response regulator